MGPDSLAAFPIGADAAHVALIERDQAWKLGSQAIGSARAGHGSVLVLEGPSGIGKSGLLAAIGALARESGVQVLSAGGRRRETEFPFGVVVQLLEPGHGGALPAIDPDDAPTREPSFGQLHALYRLCVDICGAAPLALVIDDADLADEASLRFLLYLTERIEALPLALVVAAGGVARRKQPELLLDVARHPAAIRCTLEPLSAAGTARRVTKRWLSGAADEAAVEIHDLSGGNPYLVDALVGALEAAESAPRREDVRSLVPDGVADWAMARAAELDERAAAMLNAVAVLGPGCELRNASGLAGIDPEAATETLDDLVEVGLLAAEERLSFTAPVVAAAVAAAIPPGERAAANLRAARMLAMEDAAPEHVARHLLSASRIGSSWSVDALCTGAVVALSRGAPADAVRYLRRALAEPPTRAQRAHVVLELGRAETMAGAPQAAVRLHEAVGHLTEAPEQPRAALETGRALFALGRPQQALAVFARVLDTENDSDPELRGRLRAGHATAEWLIELGNGDTRKLAMKPGDNQTPGDRALLALHAMEGAITGASGPDVRAVAEQALARGALLDDETADGLSYYLAAGALAFSEDLQTAEAALTAAVEDAQSRGSVLGFATASHVRAMTILMRGRLLDAAGDARYALAVERHGWSLGTGGARVVLASVEMERGDLEAAQRHLQGAEAAAGKGDPFRLSFLSVRGRHKLLSGDAEAALEDFLACGALADRAGVANPAIAPWRSGAGLASAVVGDWSEAERLIEKELSLARAVGAPGAVGRALRHLASIRDVGPALEALEAAVDMLQGSQAALERAAALVDFGAALRRSGKRRDARGPLKAGLELAQRCGADVLAARALRESNAAGARPRRTALHGEEALTARESQVASLAAEGLSNREIAETLVVTVKTVEWHLKHSYRKLGVSSRGQLREALGPPPGEPGAQAGAG